MSRTLPSMSRFASTSDKTSVFLSPEVITPSTVILTSLPPRRPDAIRVPRGVSTFWDPFDASQKPTPPKTRKQITIPVTW